MRIVLPLILVLTCAQLAPGDILHLKDGSTIEGDVKKSPGGWTVTRPDGTSRVVDAAEVSSIELRGSSGAAGASPATQAVDGKLYSLRRSVEHVNDPARAIERYEQFIGAHAGTPAAAEAAKDLVTWNHRRAHGLVRVGTEWVTPAERIAIQEKAILAADEARRLLRGGELKEAEAAIDAALRDDPQNPAAFYLRGLLQFQQNQLSAARKSWEAVNTLVPNHVATLNNLAVLSWRQNNPAAAMKWYDQAMAAAPLDMLVLDNVAEAMHALPPEQRESTIVRRALKRFIEQDTELQKKMAERGLFRWGGSWVDRAKLDELKAAQAEHQAELDKMAREFEEAKERVDKLDAELAANERSMRQIEANSWIIDRTGRRAQQRLPEIYYELQRDNDTLRRTRIDELARLDQLRESAKRAQAEAPAPPFTGVQKLIETDGTPIAIPDMPAGPATTRAATAPAS